MDSLPQNIEVTRIVLNGAAGRLVGTSSTNASVTAAPTTSNTTNLPQVQQGNVPSGAITPAVLASLNAAASAAAQAAADLSQAAYLASQSTISTSQVFSSLQFQLPRSFVDVVHVDWTFTSGIVAPCFCSIDEIEQKGLTLNGTPYWKYLYNNSSHINNTATYLPIRELFPKTFNTLTVRLFDANGNPLQQVFQNWIMELAIFHRNDYT